MNNVAEKLQIDEQTVRQLVDEELAELVQVGLAELKIIDGKPCFRLSELGKRMTEAMAKAEAEKAGLHA